MLQLVESRTRVDELSKVSELGCVDLHRVLKRLAHARRVVPLPCHNGRSISGSTGTERWRRRLLTCTLAAQALFGYGSSSAL